MRTPPTLNAQAPPLELDTAVFDVFSATRGTFSASSSGPNAALTFAISGGATGDTVLDGATYDVSKTSSFGTLYLNSTTGAYAFAPDNGAINALKTSTTDSFVITVSDGSLSTAQVFTININGVDDAAIISGTTTGSSIEAGGVANAVSGPSVTTGKLSDVDVDDPANTFTAVNSPTPSAHGYGTFTMTADGVWAYTLDQSNSAVQALNIGETLTDTFTVTSIGGTPQLITITINGSNDAAIISGTATGTVTEAACGEHGTPTATGRLTDTDVDNTPDSFTPVTSPKVSDHGYGSFQMTADGVWTYTLDNANCAVQALNVRDTLTDTFTVTTIDGTAQVVTITIRGTNDPAIIRGCTTGSVTEPDCDEHGKPTTRGRLTDTDVDNPPNTFTPVTCATRSAGGYGSFTMTAAGVWTYTLDTTNCAVKALSSCDTLTDTFTVTTIDGTEQTIAITIHGADDRDHFGHAAAHDAAALPHAAAIPEHNTAADGFAAVQTVAASTHDARTDDTAVSGESPDDGKISSLDGRDARFGGHERNLLASSSGDDHFVFTSTPNPGAARPDIISGFKADSERIDLTALGALTFAVLALDFLQHDGARTYDRLALRQLGKPNHRLRQFYGSRPEHRRFQSGGDPSQWLLHHQDVGFHACAGNVGSCDGSRAGQSGTGRGQRRDRWPDDGDEPLIRREHPSASRPDRRKRNRASSEDERVPVRCRWRTNDPGRAHSVRSVRRYENAIGRAHRRERGGLRGKPGAARQPASSHSSRGG